LADSSIQRLRERLTKLLHQNDLANQKGQMLEEQMQRDREREQMLTGLTHQLMDRQRELNVMLNRANIMLSRAQEANTILSLEFTELCHALPAPEDPDVQDRIQRINDLFKNTGISDAEVTMEPGANQESVIVTPPPSESPTTDAPFVVIEEATTAAGNGADSSPSDEARVDHLFRRTGEEEDEDHPVATPSPAAYDIDSEPEEPTFVEEAIPDFQPAFTDDRGFSIPDMPSEPEPEPVGVASADSSESSASSRRWWQLLGRH
jgi:hypothetical protein